MKRLLSTRASRAWTGVVVLGVVVIALVIGLALVPRLSAGQELIDAAEPAMTDEAVKGEVGGTQVLSQYVDLADPLMTRKGRSREELGRLVTMIKRKTGVSAKRARALLSREAPHTAALLRAVPFSGVADERRRLTAYLSKTLNIPAEDLQNELAGSFPRIYELLSDLPSITSGWYDVPGVEGLTRFDGTTVKTMPEVRDYLRDDLVASVEAEHDRFQALAGSGGIGYIPWLLLVLGAGLAVFGLVHARWSAAHPSGRVAWGAVIAVGVLVMIVVGALQYFPRLMGAHTTIAKLQPAFHEQRVLGLRAGTDLVVQAVRLGDPIMTSSGGAAGEVPKLVTFVSERAGLSERAVRRQLARAAPRTMALFEAIPLTAVAKEVPHLVAVLSRKLHLSRDRLVKRLRKRTPGLAQAILAVGPTTSGWNSIPHSKGLTRFGLGTPVRSAPEFADYLDGDVVPVFENRRGDFDELAGTWPPVQVLPGIVLGVGALLALYGVAMLFVATRRPKRS
ncbi:MAG: hypothetical protein QOJ46_1524 [bacterium]